MSNKLKLSTIKEEVLKELEAREFSIDNKDLIRDMAKFVIEMVNYYEKSTKFDVAFNFAIDLINKQIIITEDYYKYLSNEGISRQTIYNILLKCIQDNIKRL